MVIKKFKPPALPPCMHGRRRHDRHAGIEFEGAPSLPRLFGTGRLVLEQADQHRSVGHCCNVRDCAGYLAGPLDKRGEPACVDPYAACKRVDDDGIGLRSQKDKNVTRDVERIRGPPHTPRHGNPQNREADRQPSAAIENPQQIGIVRMIVAVRITGEAELTGEHHCEDICPFGRRRDPATRNTDPRFHFV